MLFYKYFKIQPELSDVFPHEWAHSWLKYNIPIYSFLNSPLREQMADDIMNNLRGPNKQQINRKHNVTKDNWGYEFYKNCSWYPFKRK